MLLLPVTITLYFVLPVKYALSFLGGGREETLVVSGSDDCSIKLWKPLTGTIQVYYHPYYQRLYELDHWLSLYDLFAWSVYLSGSLIYFVILSVCMYMCRHVHLNACAFECLRV